MKRICFITLLVAVSAFACSGAPGNGHGEEFSVFLERFVQDERFQISRIEFPLRALIGSPSQDPVEKAWSSDKFQENFTIPLSREELKAKGLEEKTVNVGQNEVEVRQYQPASDSYLLTYIFKHRQGGWFLIYFEDSSY